ncbi:hypothetical protein F5Y08DRAFT_352081 [Xylaria arbuscula]|nr:hypothetical protein F5Y08DRAFT_352081 [Xylaria arbuscula]
MASPLASPSAVLAFGLQMEFLICPKPEKIPQLVQLGWNMSVGSDNDREAQRKINSNIIREQITRSMINSGISTDMDPTEYQSWIFVSRDRLDEAGNFWRFETFSRPLRTNENWKLEVSRVFAVLNRDWWINTTATCSMHVHVLPGLTDTDSYDMPQVRGLLRAIAYYDDAITKIMPAEHKNNPWAPSNFNSQDAPEHLREAYAAVPTEEWAPVFFRIALMEMRDHVHAEFDEREYLSWGFSNLHAPCGSVVFRRPPAVQTAAAAKHWIGVALGLVSEAMVADLGPYESRNYHGSVEDLKKFIESGIDRLGIHCERAVINERLVEDSNPPTVFTVTQLQAIDRRKQEMAALNNLFELKVRFALEADATERSLRNAPV